MALVLQSDRLVLREPRKSDAATLAACLNNLEVCRYLWRMPFPYTRAMADAWLASQEKASSEQPRRQATFAIQLKPGRRLIGVVALHDIDAFNGIATLGYWLSQPYWRQGIMTEAVRLVLEHAFSELSLRRMNVSAAAPNIASNALIRRVGFRCEGTLRQAMRCKSTGDVHDENVYGMLREEWAPSRTEIPKDAALRRIRKEVRIVAGQDDAADKPSW